MFESTYCGPKRARDFLDTPSIPTLIVPESQRNVLPIFAFDPGGVTGWSLLTLHRKPFGADIELLDTTQDECIKHKRSWFHGEIDCLANDFELGVWRIKKIIDLYPHAAVVFEDFWVRQLSVDLAPIKIISAVRQHLWENGRQMFVQSASQAKTMATDDRLKLWKCYTREGGLGHARDADRHALLFLRKCLGHKGIKHRKEAWPYAYGG